MPTVRRLPQAIADPAPSRHFESILLGALLTVFAAAMSVSDNGLLATLATDRVRVHVASSSHDEGPLRTASQPVEYILAESHGRVPIALRVHAQLFYLHRSDAGFEARLRLFQQASESKRAVRVTFRSYSGRIVAVTWAQL